jgi:hypothetical protein
LHTATDKRCRKQSGEGENQEIRADEELPGTEKRIADRGRGGGIEDDDADGMWEADIGIELSQALDRDVTIVDFIDSEPSDLPGCLADGGGEVDPVRGVSKPLSRVNMDLEPIGLRQIDRFEIKERDLFVFVDFDSTENGLCTAAKHDVEGFVALGAFVTKVDRGDCDRQEKLGQENDDDEAMSEGTHVYGAISILSWTRR